MNDSKTNFNYRFSSKHLSEAYVCKNLDISNLFAIIKCENVIIYELKKFK